MSGLKQSEIINLSLRDLQEMFHRCDEFAQLLRLTRMSGGKYNRVERLLNDAHVLENEMERLRQKARAS